MPADLFLLLERGREAEDLHAIVIKRVSLGKVDDVEGCRSTLSSVCNPEEEPLSVSIGVDVVLKKQIVLVF